MAGPFHIEDADSEGWFYLSSLDASVNGKYLIRGKARGALEAVRARLAAGELPEPHKDASRFHYVRMSGGTPIYEA